MTFILARFFVFALEYQNAFGKIFRSETFGPTTMMSGNVSQLYHEMGNVYNFFFKKYNIGNKFIRQLITVMGFLAGFFIGGVAANYLSLEVAIVPELLLVFYYINTLGKTRTSSLTSDNKFFDKMNLK